MNKTVEKFGKVVTDKVRTNPAMARRLLATAFKGYAMSLRLPGKSQELKARNYLMSVCNNATAQPLLDPGNSVIVSIFTPCEVFHAMGMDVVFPEGLGCYMTASACEEIFIDSAEKNGIPETFCSYHKNIIGMAKNGVLRKPKFIVNTTIACDANQLTFRWLAEYFDVPHFVLDVPREMTPENLIYMEKQLHDMTAFVEKNLGRKMEKYKLRKVMQRSIRTIGNYRKTLMLKADRYEPTRMTSHMMDIFALHVLLGTKESDKYAAMLVKEVEALPRVKKGVRLLWVHTMPYWETAMCNMLNCSDRVEIVTCDMDFDGLITMKSNKPYESMAKWTINNHFNGGAERRIDNVLYYAKHLNIDGIVYFCHWGCKQTMGASALAKTTFENEGFPTLVLDGDGCDKKNLQEGPIITRLEAFIEQLESQKEEIK
jgi:Benzoyl-CoA reductase/2-hydroxyglutaryl-CoA dehydratase subunit, BcrC/BadD/HgdB